MIDGNKGKSISEKESKRIKMMEKEIQVVRKFDALTMRTILVVYTQNNVFVYMFIKIMFSAPPPLLLFVLIPPSLPLMLSDQFAPS